MPNYPQGRLTLQSGNPVQTCDQLNTDTIYYAPLIGLNGTAPIYDGTSLQDRLFISSDTDQVGLSVIIDSNSAHTGHCISWNLYDLFIFWNGSASVLGYGPAWSQPVAPTADRGTGSGTTELEFFKRLWVNKNAIVLRYGVNSGDFTTISARQATFLGTFLTQGNVRCDMPLKPTPAAGGTQNFVCLSNAYNACDMTVLNRDSSTSWTYSSASVQMANHGANGGNNERNRIWWVDCLGIYPAEAEFSVTVTPIGSAANAYTCGVGFEQVTNLGLGIINQAAFVGSTSQGSTITGYDTSNPVLGLRWVHALEQSTTAGMNIYANGFTALKLMTKS